MPCKIVIPSHKRHDRVFAKKLVNDPIIALLKVKLTYINNLTRNVKLLLILTTLWASSRNVTGWQSILENFSCLMMMSMPANLFMWKKENLAG